MKIAILTLGTRGDVQPYAVLGKALKDRGHEVVLSTAKNFESLVASYGLDFVPVELDFQELVKSKEAGKLMKSPLNALRSAKNLKKLMTPLVLDALKIFYDLSKRSDKVLFHIKTMADNFADQFPEKMIKTDVVPASQPTAAFPNPVFSAFCLPPFLNRFTFKLTELGLKMWTKPIQQFRQSVGLPINSSKPDLMSIYGVSELLLKKPDDFPNNSFFTGFWFDHSSAELSQDLVDFIAGGEPPLLVTFGSMPFDKNLDIPELINMLSKQLNIRIIVVKGWGLSDTEALSQNPDVKVIDAAPYDKLFPLVKAVVHHGGIGTTASCLKAGKPFLTCPVLHPLGDQFFWGKIAFEKGLALYPLPVKKLTKEKFMAAIKALLGNESLYMKAREFSKQLNQEDGIKNAIAYIEKDQSWVK
ncbi:glycosyltransferase family 1 protein [Sphingobacterium olei]|uniref:Glycosyltransferase family 1 protein n=1 Tax=Sphingobacterium olei TaxID=2571155 RepID=A0A4V5MNC9_9SPHI|nr:glycosyltransferase [Sphingobacterium olei]TJZ61108.1 glycosyltransferase family 1 protein [Sphingobacterium olei]